MLSKLNALPSVRLETSMEHPSLRVSSLARVIAARAAGLGPAHALAVQAKPQVAAGVAALVLVLRPHRNAQCLRLGALVVDHHQGRVQVLPYAGISQLHKPTAGRAPCQPR